MAGLGLIMTIIVGAIAGWLAEKIMKADHGLFMNILLGIVGAVVLNYILSNLVGFTAGGLIQNLAVAVAGACGLIYAGRLIRK